jgi:hypothetical protein
MPSYPLLICKLRSLHVYYIGNSNTVHDPLYTQVGSIDIIPFG